MTNEERAELQRLYDKGYRYVARDRDTNWIWAYHNKPIKLIERWERAIGGDIGGEDVFSINTELPVEWKDKEPTLIADLLGEEKKGDNINHPSHYNTGKIEVIDYIEDQNLSYNLGNAVKYISRAGKKCPEKLVEDLGKALWSIEREIQRLEVGDE